MPGPLPTASSEKNRPGFLPDLGSFVLALSMFGLLNVLPGCGVGSGGTLDLDAVRQKTIAEGKADPIPESPTTPEARKARADRLIKEAALQKSKPKTP